MEFSDFEILNFDDLGAAWGAGTTYIPVLLGGIHDVIGVAFEFAMTGASRRPTHAEVVQLARDVDSIIESYLAAIPDDEQHSYFTRGQQQTSEWLGDALWYFRTVESPSPVPDLIPPADSETEINLFGVAALMDIDAGLVLWGLADADRDDPEKIRSMALASFFSAAEGIRAASGIEVRSAADGTEVGSLSSDRARALANKRHEPSKRVKDEAIRLFREGSWPSTLQAAIAITPKVREFARKQGVRVLGTDRAQQTVYDWLRALGK